VRAVNLIPPDRRRGSSAVGRSGGAVYVLLGALGGLMILAALYAVANHQVADRKAKLVQANQESAAAQAQAAQLAPYQQLADMKNQREQAIAGLAHTRFDWPGAMHNVAAALPAGVALATFDASLGQSGGSSSSPAAAPAGATGAGATAGTVHLTGCAGSHTQVGDVMNRLRGVPGVLSVTFQSSSKGGSSGGTGGGGSPASGPAGGCSGPQFDLTVSFGSASAATPAAGAGSAQATSAGAPGPAPTPGATSPNVPPAATPTPSGAHQ
jgi:Tfp pilus assembly protein PilN